MTKRTDTQRLEWLANTSATLEQFHRDRVWECSAITDVGVLVQGQGRTFRASIDKAMDAWEKEIDRPSQDGCTC